jgi:hypothetical protein
MTRTGLRTFFQRQANDGCEAFRGEASDMLIRFDRHGHVPARHVVRHLAGDLN